MDSDWLTGLLVVFMVTIAVGLLWSGTMFGSGHKPAPIIIETPTAVVETKDNKKKPRQRTNPQQSPKVTIQESTDTKESAMPTSSSSPDVTENLPSRSPRKKKTKAAKRDQEMTGNAGEVAKETESADDGMWQTQLSRQQKQELLRQRRQQEQENTTHDQSSSESASPPEESIEKQIANATDDVVTASNTDSKSEDQLMYLENNDDSDAWLVINEEQSSS